jgi:hypothetical protein
MLSNNFHAPTSSKPPLAVDPAGEPAAPAEKPTPLEAWPIGGWVVTLGPALLSALWSILEAALLTAATGLALVLGVTEWVVRLVKGKAGKGPPPGGKG